MSVNGTLVEDKMRRFKGECEHFSFNNRPIYTYDGASAKFSTNSHDTVNSVRLLTGEKEQEPNKTIVQKTLASVYSLYGPRFIM